MITMPSLIKEIHLKTDHTLIHCFIMAFKELQSFDLNGEILKS